MKIKSESYLFVMLLRLIHQLTGHVLNFTPKVRNRNKREENPQAYERKRIAFNSPMKTFYPGRIQQNEETREEVPENLSMSEDLFNIDNNEKPKQSLGGLSPVQFQEHNPKRTYLMIIKD